MAIKEVPVKLTTYHNLLVADAKSKIKELKEKREVCISKLKEKRKLVAESYDDYKSSFGIELNKYEEFVNDKYSTGLLYKTAKGLFINRSNDYALVASLFDLYSYATTQKDIYEIDKQLAFNKKLVALSYKEYTNIVRTFYTEVHRQLILNGYGYAFSGRIGWICFNRVVMGDKAKPILDYVATKKREAELIAQGKRIYNKEEAEWCKKNGIEYKAEDKLVFRRNEVVYELPLLYSTLNNATLLKLEVADYRHSSLRGKGVDDLLEMCDNDVNKICNLPIDIKLKLNLCNKADKLLYTKFIRNENQYALGYGKARSKDRQ